MIRTCIREFNDHEEFTTFFASKVFVIMEISRSGPAQRRVERDLSAIPRAGKKALVSLFCWAHVRRYRVPAGDASPVQRHAGPAHAWTGSGNLRRLRACQAGDIRFEAKAASPFFQFISARTERVSLTPPAACLQIAPRSSTSQNRNGSEFVH